MPDWNKLFSAPTFRLELGRDYNLRGQGLIRRDIYRAAIEAGVRVNVQNAPEGGALLVTVYRDFFEPAPPKAPAEPRAKTYPKYVPAPKWKALFASAAESGKPFRLRAHVDYVWPEGQGKIYQAVRAAARRLGYSAVISAVEGRQSIDVTVCFKVVPVRRRAVDPA